MFGEFFRFLDEVLTFLENTDPKLCVVSTCKNNNPQCAIMGYAVKKDLTIILSTDDSSRKWDNVKTNPKTAINFGWSFSTLNIQYEGWASLIGKKHKDFKQCEEIYMNAHPESLEFKDLSSTVYIKIRPTWIRLNDYLVEPPRILEFDKFPKI